MSDQIICKTCVMDKSAREIVFNDLSCNFCAMAQKELALAESLKPTLSNVIQRIKRDGRKKEYDVLIGLSGGADSSSALYEAVNLGLRPLCYSIDNFWNTKESDENILRLVEGMKVPFYRYTIDQKKFVELQGSFLQAGLINAEIPTDHLLMATSFEMASRYGIKWIISGGNVATESIMPESWSYTARDLVHIKDVFEKMTYKKLQGLPLCGLWLFNYYKWIKGIKTLYLLDYFNYNRSEYMYLLHEKFGYKDYGEKHEESTFTKWYQNYYLFEKFGIDKRKAHYSSMINSGQMTREEALFLLTANPIYPEIGLEARIMNFPKRSHRDFKTDEKTFQRISTVVKFLRKYAHIGRLHHLGT